MFFLRWFVYTGGLIHNIFIRHQRPTGHILLQRIDRIKPTLRESFSKGNSNVEKTPLQNKHLRNCDCLILRQFHYVRSVKFWRRTIQLERRWSKYRVYKCNVWSHGGQNHKWGNFTWLALDNVGWCRTERSMNHIPSYLFQSRADDDDIRELGKRDFCSLLVHPMLSNANHFTSLFCRELFRIFLKCVRHVRHVFSPLLIRPITFLACGAVIAFVDGTSTTAKTFLLTCLNSIRINGLEITGKKNINLSTCALVVHTNEK